MNYAYAYFNKNGTLKEFIVDPSVRQGNVDFNAIYIYWEDESQFNAIQTSYFRSEIDEEWSDPVPVTDIQSKQFSIPAIADYDPTFFKYGKKYQGYLIPLTEEMLQYSGSVALNIRMLEDNTIVKYLGIITFYSEITGAKLDVNIPMSLYNELLLKFGDFTTTNNLIVVINTGDDVSNFNDGQLLFNKDNKTMYQKVNGELVAYEFSNIVELINHPLTEEQYDKLLLDNTIVKYLDKFYYKYDSDTYVCLEISSQVVETYTRLVIPSIKFNENDWNAQDILGPAYYNVEQTFNLINQAISSVYRYRGSVPTYNDLPPAGMITGDVYNVEDTGDNYAWTGTEWDKLGGEFNLNMENGSGVNAVQQKQDGTSGVFDFTNKNPNATALDPTLTGQISYGGVGGHSASFGGKSQASGKRSLSQGTTTIAKGNYSHAEGDNSVAYADDSHAEGFATLSAGVASHTEGSKTQVLTTLPESGGGGDTPVDPPSGFLPNDHRGEASHAEGSLTTVYGFSSHAEGANTIVKGHYAHAEGVSTMAVGAGSKSYGNHSTANGDYSVAGGSYTTANQTGSFAHGYGASTYAEYSTAFGDNTQTVRRAQFAVGVYNIGKTTTLFEVGNGSSNSTRSNAFEVYTDGHAEVYSVSTDSVYSVINKKYLTDNFVPNTVKINSDSSYTGAILVNSNDNVNTVVRKDNITVTSDGRLTVNANPISSMDVATKQYVDRATNDVRAVAEGKTTTYVLDYNATYNHLGFFDMEGNFHNDSEFEEYVSGYTLGNPIFNSLELDLNLIPQYPEQYYFIIEAFDRVGYTILKSSEISNYLKTGDNILVKNPEVPDRWYSYLHAYALEAREVSLNQYLSKTEAYSTYLPRTEAYNKTQIDTILLNYATLTSFNELANAFYNLNETSAENEIKWSKMLTFSKSVDTTFTFETAKTNCLNEYKAIITNSGASAITITLPSGTTILTNDDNIVVSSNTFTLPSGISVELNCVNSNCAIINWQAQ